MKKCPVKNMHNYLQVRPYIDGQLFCHFDGTPLTSYQFSALLKRALNVLGIDNSQYKSHSFRIGMATTFALEGASKEQIKELGRWSSESYLRYIRLPY